MTFGGLLVALYVWKCLMLVAFQNKIIYMPSFPPNSRSERIADYAGQQCGDIEWADERTKAADGTDLAMAVATVPLPKGSRRIGAGPATGSDGRQPKAHVYILYFQGNASSIPPRLPGLSWVLRAVSDSKAIDLSPVHLTFVCLSYRGFWTSRGRPSENGLRLDAEAGAEWISRYHKQKYGDGSDMPVPILLIWGQSIGCGVATNLAATGRLPTGLPIEGLILETPFLSVKAMLETLYPQKWLPYKRLWPFLRNHLDSESNLDLIAKRCREDGKKLPSIHILEAERDEIVPREHGDLLYQKCNDLGVPVVRDTIPVAFHNEAIARGDGKKLAANAILQLIRRALDSS
ncbi:alpha/beta-hydrolase [Rhypophila sp. PSN 637]